MLILCWHWNSFPFIQKLLHDIRLEEVEHFYSSNFSTVIFFFWRSVPCSVLGDTPCHTKHNSLNVITLRFRYIYVNFNRTLYKPNQVNIFASVRSFSARAPNAAGIRACACLRACVRASVRKFVTKRAHTNVLYNVHINLIMGNDFHLQIKSGIEYHCWMKCFFGLLLFCENFIIIRSEWCLFHCITK